MNRRTYLKGFAATLILSLTSIPAYKWISINRHVDIGLLKRKETILAELVELIIPETETPGAKRAGVHHYIINVVANCMGARQQNKFLEGLLKLESFCLDQYKKTFVNCNPAEKQDVLTFFAENSEYSIEILNKINNKYLGGSFYNTLKNLTIEGYCTSMLGATQGLAYDYIPGTFEACIPLRPGQKSWATK